MRRYSSRKGPPEKLDRWAAVSLSTFVLPGAGQIYNGQKKKGIILCVLTIAAVVGALMELTMVILAYSNRLAAASVDLDALGDGTGVEISTRLWVLLFLALALHVVNIVDAWWVARRKYQQYQAMQSQAGNAEDHDGSPS